MSDKEKIKRVDRRGQAEPLLAPIAKKREITRQMSNYSGYKQAVCADCYDALVSAVKELLLDGNHVYIRGMAYFTLKQTKRRKFKLFGEEILARPIRKVEIKLAEDIKKALHSMIIEEGEDLEDEDDQNFDAESYDDEDEEGEDVDE